MDCSRQAQRESVERATADLEAAFGRAGAVLSASVSEPYCVGAGWRVVVSAETVSDTHCGSFALRPRFGSQADAEAFRTAALEIVTAAA